MDETGERALDAVGERKPPVLPPRVAQAARPSHRLTVRIRRGLTREQALWFRLLLLGILLASASSLAWVTFGLEAAVEQFTRHSGGSRTGRASRASALPVQSGEAKPTSPRPVTAQGQGGDLRVEAARRLLADLEQEAPGPQLAAELARTARQFTAADVPLLIQQLEQAGTDRARRYYASLLGRAGDSRAFGPLPALLGSTTSTSVMEAAAGALARTRDPRVPQALESEYERRSETERPWLLDPMARHPTARTARLLLETAESSPHVALRRSATQALASLRDQVTTQQLVSILERESDLYCRLNLLSALALRTTPEALDALRHAATDADPTVSRRARATVQEAQGGK